MNDTTLTLEFRAPAAAGPFPTSVRLHGKELRVELTPAAQRAAAALTQPMLVEMELYFSCLVRKRVLIKPLEDAFLPGGDTVPFTDRLRLGFRPVIAEQCRIADLGDAAPPLQTMPVKRPAAYIPHWLRLDYRKGQWTGDFGYQD
jgi:hypothetical protein